MEIILRSVDDVFYAIFRNVFQTRQITEKGIEEIPESLIYGADEYNTQEIFQKLFQKELLRASVEFYDCF